MLCALLLFLLVFIGPSHAGQDMRSVTTAEVLNVRQSPDGQVIDKLPKGTVVNILGFSGRWAHIKYFRYANDTDPLIGYVSVDYLGRMGSGNDVGNLLSR